MIGRTVVALLAILLAVQIVRTAAINALAQTRPYEAELIWSGHPAAELSLAASAIEGGNQIGSINPSMSSLVADAATKEPLAAEPFLLGAVEAQRAGDIPKTQRLFEAAQWRDPRSLAAASFLANRYLETGKIGNGLRELAALSRLAPPVPVASYVVAYAKNPRTWPILRALLRSNPPLRETVLTKLASGIETVPTALALAGPDQQWGQSQWFPSMLETLTQAGEYERARDLWAHAIGAKFSGQLLYDPSFTDDTSPPPFNWSLTTSNVGFAERQRGGGLHVIFYGKEDGFLASQLILLPPGSYVLAMQLHGNPAQARSLNWSVWCDNSAEPLVSSAVDSVAAHEMHFKVPASCPAQWVRLGGTRSGMGQRAEILIQSLRLQRLSEGA